jgi:aminoglycoside phosphotransferase family enzyme/predicted kinase
LSNDPVDPAITSALARPEAHPTDASAAQGVDHVQTHLSHVYLTTSRVYKLHKAVAFDFVDFSRREERNADCLREVLLNRRLAPDAYLGVAPVLERNGAIALGPPADDLLQPRAGRAPEHCIVMRRLPDGRDALSLLERGELTAAQIGAAAECVARFHAGEGLGAPAPFSRAEWRARAVDPFLDCGTELGSTALSERVVEWMAAHEDRLERRRVDGRAVDGHGDLHMQHLWFETETPIVIDCISFSAVLRQIDAAADVAFLAMDLRYRGRADLAELFLRRYASASDDHGLYGVVDFFISYRAAVRAKVAGLAARDVELAADQRAGAVESERRHLELALASLETRPAGAVLVISGVVGSGKSTVGRRLEEETSGVLISADLARKARAGLEPTQRGGEARGLYSDAATEAVYASLAERAATVSASGRVAILDATYGQRAWRDGLRQYLAPSGIEPLLVEARAARELTLERLAKRQRADADPSDAGPERLEPSEATYQPPTEWPEGSRYVVHTDRDGLADELASLLERLESRA